MKPRQFFPIAFLALFCSATTVCAQEMGDPIDLIAGGSLAAWTEHGKDVLPEAWEVRDGAITCNGKGNGSLATKVEYGDFELTGEWKVSEGANSGILLRVPKDVRDAASGGLEIQVIDHSDGWKKVHGGGIGMGQSAGALYGFYPAIESSVKHAGEWNTFKIIMDGARVAVWHNETLVADADTKSEDWAKRLAGSKFAKSKRFNQAAKGHIVLQNYRGGEVAYRNLKLRPIKGQAKAAAKVEGAKKKHPHVILVMSDDHGYGDCGYTGHPFVQTPNLDAMAKEGIVFDRFYAAAPVCSPTRAALLTGRHAFRVNVPNHGLYLRPQEVTMAEVFRDNGYVTGHFGKWHIGSVQPGSPTSPGGQGFDEWLSGLNFFDNDPYLSHKGEYRQIKGAGSVISTDATIEFMKRHHKGDKPLFAVTWFPAPHDPFGEIPQGIEGAETLYDDKVEKPRYAGYYREITLLDQQIGRLRATVRELGIAEDTIFLYCSDNGGLVDKTAGGRGLKGHIYEGGLRVPAIVEYPGTFAPGRVGDVVSSCDLLPTMTQLAGIKFDPPHRLDGIDVSPLLQGKTVEHRPVGFWHGFANGEATWSDRIIKALMDAKAAGKPNPLPRRFLKNVEEFPEFEDGVYKGHAAWLDWPWKLHRKENAKTGVVKIEIYHLENDPQERTNLAEKELKRTAAMKSALENWQRGVLESWEGADYREAASR